MRLAPHTAQHLLDAASPVPVPRPPTGAFPRVHMRVPGLRGEPTGGGPSPCAPAFPGADSSAHTATPSGLGVSPRVAPWLLPARLPIPWGASHVHGSGLLRRPGGSGVRPSLPLSAAPQHDAGSTGSPASPFSPFLELRGYGACFAAYGLHTVLAVLVGKGGQGTSSPEDAPRFRWMDQGTTQSSTASAGLPSAHGPFQGHAAHHTERPVVLSPNDSWDAWTPTWDSLTCCQVPSSIPKPRLMAHSSAGLGVRAPPTMGPTGHRPPARQPGGLAWRPASALPLWPARASCPAPRPGPSRRGVREPLALAPAERPWPLTRGVDATGRAVEGHATWGPVAGLPQAATRRGTRQPVGAPPDDAAGTRPRPRRGRVPPQTRATTGGHVTLGSGARPRPWCGALRMPVEQGTRNRSDHRHASGMTT